MAIPKTGGRPKTGPGHRDDAMLSFLEFEGRTEALIRLEQQHYRERRDLLTAMKEDARRSALSWRFGEIVDSQVAEATAMAAGAK